METLKAYLILAAVVGIPVFAVTYYFRMRRCKALGALAASLGLPFYPDGPDPRRLWETGFELFRLGRSQNACNLIEVPFPGGRIQIFDYHYTDGGGRATYNFNLTLALTPGEGVPSFDLRPENLMDKMGEMIGFTDLDFPDFPLFSDKYRLIVLEEASARKFFNPARLAWFERHLNLHVNGIPGNVLISSPGICLPVEEWPGVIEWAKNFAAEVLK